MVQMLPFPWNPISGQTEPFQVGTGPGAPSLVNLSLPSTPQNPHCPF